MSRMLVSPLSQRDLYLHKICTFETFVDFLNAVIVQLSMDIIL